MTMMPPSNRELADTAFVESAMSEADARAAARQPAMRPADALAGVRLRANPDWPAGRRGDSRYNGIGQPGGQRDKFR